MPALSDYTAGTITLTNNSTAFTGTGTGWLAAGFREGDTIFQVAGQTQWDAVIATITSNTEGTLVRPWGGATGTYQYRMRYMADGARVTAQARNLIELLGNGNLQAEAGIDGTGGNWLSYYTGAGTKARTALTAFARTLLDDANAAEFYATLGQIPNAQVRNDLTPDKAFRRGNILGTVSQSGGVPTGAIIERGSNANGEYVRLADGTQICLLAPVTITNNVQSFAGGMFHRGLATVTFPATFAVPPNSVQSSINFTNDPGTPGHQSWSNAVVNINQTTCLVRTISFVLGSDVTVSTLAIGRWFN